MEFPERRPYGTAAWIWKTKFREKWSHGSTDVSRGVSTGIITHLIFSLNRILLYVQRDRNLHGSKAVIGYSWRNHKERRRKESVCADSLTANLGQKYNLGTSHLRILLSCHFCFCVNCWGTDFVFNHYSEISQIARKLYANDYVGLIVQSHTITPSALEWVITNNKVNWFM